MRGRSIVFGGRLKFQGVECADLWGWTILPNAESPTPDPKEREEGLKCVALTLGRKLNFSSSVVKLVVSSSEEEALVVKWVLEWATSAWMR
jgi:hypothetical protein